MKSKIITRVLVCCCACLISMNLRAQEEGHVHTPEEPHHHKNEISIAVGLVPLPDEDILSYGIHLHYIRGIGHENRVGIGIGLETIVDEHKHYTISGVMHYRIYKGLIFSLAPGLLILKKDGEFVFQYAQHIEMAYEFEVRKIHIGPVVEVGFETLGTHYMAGLHIGVDF